MAAGRIVIPGWMPALDSNGAPIPNAQIYVYLNGTTTLATVYSDDTLTTPIANPVEANSSGQFPEIWADDANLFSISVDAPYGPPGIPFTFDSIGPATASAVIEVATETAEAVVATKANVVGDNTAPIFPIAVQADPMNSAAVYGTVDRTGATSSSAAINAQLAATGDVRLKLPVGSLLASTTLLEDRTGDTQYPPRNAKSLLGAGGNQTFFSSTVNGWWHDSLGGDFLSGGAEDQAEIGGFTLRGGSQNPANNRKGIRLARTRHRKLTDIRIMEFVDPFEMVDAVGGIFERFYSQFNLNPMVFKPGPDYDTPGNPGSPPNELVFNDFHSSANLNGGVRFERCGNLTFVGGSFEGMGSIALSGQTQVADADGIRLVNPGTNAVVGLTLLGTHFETNKGRSDIALIAGDRDIIINLVGTDHFQNGAQVVTQNILLDLTNSTARVVVNLHGCGFNLVNGATSGVVFTVINPNNRIEGVHWEVNNFGCIIQSGITHPGFTNEKFLPTGATAVSSGGTLTNTTVEDRYIRMGKLLHRSTVITGGAGSIGTPSGVLFVVSAQIPGTRLSDLRFEGITNGGEVVVATTSAGNTNLQLIKQSDGSFPLGPGVTIKLQSWYETV